MVSDGLVEGGCLLPFLWGGLSGKSSRILLRPLLEQGDRLLKYNKNIHNYNEMYSRKEKKYTLENILETFQI